MGSRAVIVVCRDEAAARERFGVVGEARRDLHAHRSAVLRRSGDRERGCSTRVRAAIARAGLWDELETDWVCLDCRADAVVGEGAGAAAQPVRGRRRRRRVGALADAVRRARVGRGATGSRIGARSSATESARAAAARSSTRTARYCWPVTSIDDLKLAPFHLLASEGSGPRRPRSRLAHGDARDGCAAADPELLSRDAASWSTSPTRAERGRAIAWWEELTAAGGEGMVVKPLDVARARARAASSSPR